MAHSGWVTLISSDPHEIVKSRSSVFCKNPMLTYEFTKKRFVSQPSISLKFHRIKFFEFVLSGISNGKWLSDDGLIENYKYPVRFL